MGLWSNSDDGRCTATCFKRDEYRYSGRGSSGFTMHYAKERCTRRALPGKEKCWQHDEETATARLLRSHERRLARWRRARARTETTV
jgi:hypothetical protein